MSTQTAQSPARGRTADALVRDRAWRATAASNHYPLESTVFACPDCGKGLDVVYDYELAASHFRDVPGSERPHNIWHFEELLPIVDASAQARVGQLRRLHAADPRRPPRRRAGARATSI